MLKGKKKMLNRKLPEKKQYDGKVNIHLIHFFFFFSEISDTHTLAHPTWCVFVNFNIAE